MTVLTHTIPSYHVPRMAGNAALRLVEYGAVAVNSATITLSHDACRTTVPTTTLDIVCWRQTVSINVGVINFSNATLCASPDVVNHSNGAANKHFFLFSSTHFYCWPCISYCNAMNARDSFPLLPFWVPLQIAIGSVCELFVQPTRHWHTSGRPKKVHWTEMGFVFTQVLNYVVVLLFQMRPVCMTLHKFPLEE